MRAIGELQDAEVALKVGKELDGKPNESESRFAERAAELGCVVHRGGWPDFLITSPDGKLIGVEVKRGSDSVSVRQAAMFAALESGGLNVFVWDGDCQGRLIPWRKSFRSRIALATLGRLKNHT